MHSLGANVSCGRPRLVSARIVPTARLPACDGPQAHASSLPESRAPVILSSVRANIWRVNMRYVETFHFLRVIAVIYHDGRYLLPRPSKKDAYLRQSDGSLDLSGPAATVVIKNIKDRIGMKRNAFFALVCLAFIVGCSGPLKKPDESSPTANRLKLTSDGNDKVVYPHRDVFIKTPDGKTMRFTSDSEGVVKLPDGKMFDPVHLKIQVCRLQSGCTVPPPSFD